MIAPVLRIIARAVEVAGVHVAVHQAMQARYTYLIIFYFSTTIGTPGVTASRLSSAPIGEP